MTDSIFDPNKIDKLKLYFGKPYSITCPTGKEIVVYQPTIGEIMERGEHEVYSVVNVFIANPTMYRLQLWDQGFDWNDMTEYELFMMTSPTLNKEDTEILFGDLDFSKFEKCIATNPETEEQYITLYNPEQDIEINEATHKNLMEYVRFLFNMYPKVEKAKGKATKEALIWEDRDKQERNKNKEQTSMLLPMISSCLNHPGFKYKKKELVDVGLVEFMDSVQRLQIYESTTALLKGMYSGFCDTSKIPKENFDFMREIKYGRKHINPNHNKGNNTDSPKPIIPELSGISDKVKEKLNDIKK